MDFVDYVDDYSVCQYDDGVEKEYTALKSKENEEQIELRRLRTENRLLRQRIDNLEKESASLADKLIHDQVTRATEAEETYALKNKLSTTTQKLLDTQKQLEEAQHLIGDIKDRTSSITSASSLDEGEAQSVIQGLQEELIALRLKDADIDSLVKELRAKIKELEDTNLQLQKAPTNDIQHLQEELIAVKLREAEGNLSLKEMRQKVHDLESHWENYLAKQALMDTASTSPKDKNNKQELKQLQDELMTVKIREANCLSNLKEAKQKLMELETQNHICTNQIRRMDDENKNMKKQMKEAEDREKELKHQIKEFTRKIDDLESQKKEESMMFRIKEAENAEVIGELKQQIAQLEIQKAELQTADQLEAKDGTQELENRIYDLQDEVFQLKLSQLSPNTLHYKSPDKSRLDDSDEDDDDEDDEDLENPESLNRTLSEIIEGTRRNDSDLNSSQQNGALFMDNSTCNNFVDKEKLISQNGNHSQGEVTLNPNTDELCNGVLESDANSKNLNGDSSLGERTLDSNHNSSICDQSENSCYSKSKPNQEGVVDVQIYKESGL